MTTRNPNRIQGILAHVEQVWEQYPDLRLGQLLLNALGGVTAGAPELYYMEDTDLASRLRYVYPDRGFQSNPLTAKEMVVGIYCGDFGEDDLLAWGYPKGIVEAASRKAWEDSE